MSSIENNVQNEVQCQITKELIALISVPIIDIDFKTVEDHYKKWKKDKKEEKLDAVKNKKKPTKNNKKLDDDGNVKVVQLSKYQIFVKEIQPYINETYPGIAKEERMRKVGEEWKKHKEANDGVVEKKDKKEEEKKDKKEEVVETKDEEVVETKDEEVVETKDEEVVENKEEDDEIKEEKVVEKKEAKKKVKK
jgi:hypothetical protein